MVRTREVKSRGSGFKNLSLLDERLNRETSRRTDFHSVYLVSSSIKIYCEIITKSNNSDDGCRSP